MSSFRFKPSFPVIVVRRVLSDEKDMLGNEVWVDEEREILAYCWSVPQSSEPKLAGHSQRVVAVELLAPVGAFTANDAVKLPDRDDVLEVIGEPENYEHNPFGWSPGIEVVNLGGVS